MTWLLIALLSLSDGAPEETKQKTDENKKHESKTTNQPDEDLLLFLAEWSDETDQWLDPATFKENLNQEADDETFPDRL